MLVYTKNYAYNKMSKITFQECQNIQFIEAIAQFGIKYH